MDEANRSSSSSSPRSWNRARLSQHSARLERIRRTMMRNRGEVDARRRALAGLLSDEQPAPGGGSASTQTTTASASPVKRRKIEQHHAQVEMAQLDLELAYCDGGKYKETSTRPESVLYQNDDVYCTRGSQCNMIFRQVDGKCFTLKKMVIQGPIENYDSPVQEGIIFVTMDKQDLVSGCKYPFRFENNEDEDDDDDEDNNEYEESDDDADLDTHEFPLLEPCDHSTARTESRGSFFQTLNAQAQARPDETPLEPSARFKIRRDDRGNKTKATLTFEPALSGRYILARFFSPNRQDNIDIQFIGAYGYVGRRFFPAITFR